MKFMLSAAGATAALALLLTGCGNSQSATTTTTATAEASASAGITGLADMNGKILAVQTDTTGQAYAEEHQAEFGYEIKVFDDLPGTANAVLAGTADAAMNDNGVLYDFAVQNPTTTVVEEFDTGEQYGFNVAADNPGLLSAANAALAEAQADGTFDAIYQKWFGTDAPDDLLTESVEATGEPILVEAGALTVCTHLAYRPFQYLDDDNSTIIGFDVDLVDVIAAKLGVTQTIVDIEFGQITSGAVFAAGKCDLGAAAITITEERNAAAPFTNPYFNATQALLVKG